MIKRFITFAVIICACASAAFAQTVVITPRKQVYTRKKPQSDYKKTFTIRRPIAKASTPALSRRITAAIDPAKVLGIDIREELSEIQWLSEADYEEVLNEKGVLTVEVWMEGSGAYPDGVIKYVVIDVAKGTRATPEDVFADLEGLAAAARKKQLAEIDAAKKEILADPEMTASDIEGLFSGANFEISDLSHFAVEKTGVTFYYDYGFPHVIKAHEPEGALRFSWSEIAPHIRREGLLARFVP